MVSDHLSLDRSESPSRTRRARSGVIAAAVVVLVAGMIACGAAWWVTEPRSNVMVPPASATPEMVVESYLNASNVHDVETMNSLTAGDRMPKWGRFDATWTWRDLSVGTSASEPWIGSANISYPDVVRVDVRLRIIRGHDPNFPDDTDTYWGYVLGRTANDAPWRIVDQGVL